MDADRVRLRIIEIVIRLTSANCSTEMEDDKLISELIDISPDPNIADYVFWPKKEMTPEEIADLAVSYEPIIGEWIE